MKKITTISLALCAMLLTAVFASAQTPYNTTGNSAGNAGSVGISVTVPKSSDLRTGGAATPNNGASVTTASTANDALAVSLNFADASPNQSNVSATSPYMYATVPVRMRSNSNYEVFAFRAGTLNSTNIEDFRASDVGFAIINVTRGTGGLHSAGTDTTTSGFGSDPTTAPIVNGLPSYSKTLADVDTASGVTKILSGSRISQGGDNTSTDNFNTADLRFAVKPQYYTPGTYTETVKVYIVTAP